MNDLRSRVSFISANTFALQKLQSVTYQSAWKELPRLDESAACIYMKDELPESELISKAKIAAHKVYENKA